MSISTDYEAILEADLAAARAAENEAWAQLDDLENSWDRLYLENRDAQEELRELKQVVAFDAQTIDLLLKMARDRRDQNEALERQVSLRERMNEAMHAALWRAQGDLRKALDERDAAETALERVISG